MTALEALNTVLHLLDDSAAITPMLNSTGAYSYIFDYINKAQLITISKYHMVANENCNRLLNVRKTGVASGDVVDDTYELLYPRAVILRQNALAYAVNPIYKDYRAYMHSANYKHTAGNTYPRAIYYTIQRSYDAGLARNIHYLHFNDSTGVVAEIIYIKVPPLFVVDFITPANSIGLSVSLEYQLEVCFLAADMLNTLDAEEFERSSATAGDKIAGVGIIDMAVL